MMTVEISTTRGSSLIDKITKKHDRLFGAVEHALEGWFVQLGARLMFAAILMTYYLNSATTKLGEGLLGVLAPSANAFAQILPSIAEHYEYDTTAIPFFPWHLIVTLGTVAEFVLPVLIVLGLFTRIAAVGMIGFVIIQTFVDIAFHGSTGGAFFNVQSSELVDQRLLWIFPLLVLTVKGAGSVSVDALLRHYWKFSDSSVRVGSSA